MTEVSRSGYLARALQIDQGDTPYRALALHLSPADLFAGERIVDTEILKRLRRRSMAYFHYHTAMTSGAWLNAAGLFLVASKAFPALVGIAWLAAIPWWLATGVLLIGLGLTWLSFRLSDRCFGEEDWSSGLPEAMAQWLAANGKLQGFAHWYEIYWPWMKRAVSQYPLFGVQMWRRGPPERAAYARHLARMERLSLRNGNPEPDFVAVNRAWFEARFDPRPNPDGRPKSGSTRHRE